MTDELTRLPTHRALTPSMFGDGTLAILVDIDGFRWFNCEHGFEEGDRVLPSIASSIARRAETSRRAATYRVGGDEFLVVLPDASLESATAVARSIVDEVHGMQIAYSRRDQPSRTRLEVNAVVVRIAVDMFAKFFGPHGVTEQLRDAVHPAIVAKRLETGVSAGVVAVYDLGEASSLKVPEADARILTRPPFSSNQRRPIHE